MKEKYLVFTGFVGGYGGIAKARRFIISLQERGIDPFIVTEESYSENLAKFGCSPDRIIQRMERPEDNYAEVANVLDSVDYDVMISFGPRTFGPKHATDLGRRAVIIDGGLPPFLGESYTDHAREVYLSLDSFILTCHFPWNPPPEVLSGYHGIPLRVLSQPVDESTSQSLAYLRTMTKNTIAARRDFFCLQFGHQYKGEPLLPVRMSSSLFEVENLERNGGWLKQHELDQAISFVEHFITTLGNTGERVTIPMNAKIAHQFRSLFARYPNITILPLPFLPPTENLELSRIAHLNIERAMRDVTQFEIAASGSYGIVCPCPTGYMHEDIAAEEADQRGIIRNIHIMTPDLGSRVLEYIGSDHYYASRERRVLLWEEMHSTRNIIDAVTGGDKTMEEHRREDLFEEEIRAFQ